MQLTHIKVSIMLILIQGGFFQVKMSDFISKVDMIQKFFQEKSVKLASIFGCFTKSERVTLAKILMFNTQTLSVLNIERTNGLLNLESPNQQLAVILDGDCPNVEQFLIQCGVNRYFDVKHHWLITASSESIIGNFRHTLLNVDADISVAIPNADKNWIIFDVYNAASERGGILNRSEIGYYNKEDGYNARITQSKYWMRRNMSSVTFKTMVVLPVPFKGTLEDYLNNDENRDINTFNRFHERLVSFCRDFYNFSMDMGVTKSWGYTNADGSFDGLVGELEQKKLDFGSSPLFVRTDRARVIDYGRNTWILRAVFIFRNVKAGTSIEIFLRPLSTSIWLITGLFGIMCVIILKMVTTFERKRYHFNIETSWSLSMIITLGHFCQQGAPHTPIMICGRIITIFTLLLALIINQFYSASIVSSLLMKPSTSIKNIKDILDSSLKVGCEDILYNRDYFKHTTDDVAKELYYKKILGKHNNSNFLGPAEGLDLVEQGNFAFHVEVATAYPIIEHSFPDKLICELREVKLFRTQPMHANYQKNSPFRDMLDTCLQRTAEYGILYRERKHWHPRKPECIQSSRSVTFNVGLDEFYPALLVLLIGIVSSLTMLVVEKQIKLVQDRPKKKMEQEGKIIRPFVT